MKAIVLDYTWDKVYCVRIPDELADSYEIEEYLSDTCGFHMENCHWLTTEKENVEILDEDDNLLATL